MISAALLLGAAVALLLHRPSTTARLTVLVPPAGRSESPPDQERARRLACAVLGLAAWWVVGGLPGAVLGLAAALGGPRVLSRLEDHDAREEAELLQQLPLALDLLSACLAGGGSLSDALGSVSRAVGGPCGARLARVARALAVGTPPAEAFGELGRAGAGASAGRALCRASEGGTPVAGAVSRVAEDARRRARVTARKRARRAGVMAAGPLTTCFLPAFLLIGIVPCVIGVAAPLVKAL